MGSDVEYEDHEDWWRSFADDIVENDAELRRRIDEFWATTQREAKVGSRHHTVPRFYLKRFARADQLLVRDRNTGHATVRNIGDLAIKNFYTFVNNDGEEDGRLEDIFADLEGSVNDLLGRIFGPFQPVRPLTSEESMALALYLAFQLVRTPRHRREMELLADYAVKLMSRGRVPNTAGWVAVPHPNEHIRFITRAAFKLAERLYARPVTMVTLDQPYLVTCDEPVVLVTEGDHVRHLPGCTRSRKRRLEAARRPSRGRRRNADIVHFYPTRPGVAQADELAWPISPASVLVLGPRHLPAPLHVRLDGEEATQFAEDLNRRLVEQAYIWVAAHPGHATFRELDFPPPKPLVQVCDGGSPISRALDHPPAVRQPERLSNRWRHREPT